MIVGDMERKHNINLFLLSVLLLMTVSCSTTRNLPEDETLYVGVKNMEILNEDKTPAGVQTLEEVEAALSYPPNNAILGSNSLRFPIPFGLWIYNDFVKYQDKKGVGHWIFNKLGSTPVYLSTVNPETRVKVATNLLHDYGFFNGAVTYSVDSLKNPRKAKLSYKIDMANPYYLDSVMYLKYPPRADSLIRAAYDQRVLHKGDNFSVLKLEEERQRLSTLFRNNGYYYFRPEFITFRADTLRKPGMVSLQVVPKAGVPADAKRQTNHHMENEKRTLVKLETTMGNITVALYNETPKHRDNFIKLVKEGVYDSTLFHRVIKQFMIQAGDPDSKNASDTAMLGSGDVGYTIPAEFNPKFFHKKGVLAAARQGDDVNPEKASSGCQFYIVTGRKFTEPQLLGMENKINEQREEALFDSLARQHMKEIYKMRKAGDNAGLLELQDTLEAQARELADKEEKFRFTPEQIKAYSNISP